MLEASLSTALKKSHPGAIIGLLEMSGMHNDQPIPALQSLQRRVESNLRQRYQGWSRTELLQLPVMGAYRDYYKRFDMTYHLLLQLESILLKDKSLPSVSPLVDINFMAEMDSLILTASHDVNRLTAPLLFDLGVEGDQFTQMTGRLKDMRPGDILMKDGRGISCSILYGQDDHSPISRSTTQALYVAYAPRGVPSDQVENHLTLVEDYARVLFEDCLVEQHKMLFI